MGVNSSRPLDPENYSYEHVYTGHGAYDSPGMFWDAANDTRSLSPVAGPGDAGMAAQPPYPGHASAPPGAALYPYTGGGSTDASSQARFHTGGPADMRAAGLPPTDWRQFQLPQTQHHALAVPPSPVHQASGASAPQASWASRQPPPQLHLQHSVPRALQSPGIPDTVIIFDWDDTLMCSSAINCREVVDRSTQQLELMLEQALLLAMRLGETYIVTNADELWVLESARQFAPRSLPLLARIRILSARRRFEHAYPGDAFAWKREAFRELLLSRRSAVPAGTFTGINLIVLGDSMAEMEAAHSSTVGLPYKPCLIKTVKFKEAPSFSELVVQLRIMAQELSSIVTDDRSGRVNLAPLLRGTTPLGVAAQAIPFTSQSFPGHSLHFTATMRGL